MKIRTEKEYVAQYEKMEEIRMKSNAIYLMQN